MLSGEILITGGAGAMGRAIIHKATKESWDCHITIFSTDVMKHHKIKKEYPHVGAIVGDIRDFTTLSNAMVGKDYVLHLAAQKHIPEGEYNSIDNYEVNVTGSLNVCSAAAQLGIPHVLGVSTDKACYSINAYGASKFMMEKIFAEYSRLGMDTQFHLLRLGNVLESTGSVIEAWKNSIMHKEQIKITNPNMTRFWLSPQQAVSLVIASLEHPSGWVYIPKAKALSIGKLADYIVGSEAAVNHQVIPIRPGEKMHETLLTIEEAKNAFNFDDHFAIQPSTAEANPYHLYPTEAYTSDRAPELSRNELMELLKNE